jgi:hypothetical protein
MGVWQSREVAALRAENARLTAALEALPAAISAASAAAQRARRRAEDACFEKLPLAVVVRILGFLPNPDDVFAAARTCRVAHEASRTAGAFPHVDVSALDEAQCDARWERLLGRRSGRHRASSADAFAGFLAGCDAGAGIRTLVLSRDFNSDLSVASVCALVARCAALERLLGLRDWPPADAERILTAAAATPLRHVNCRRCTPALRALPGLTSLCLAYAHCAEDAHDALDLDELQALLATGQLQRLELAVVVESVEPLELRSDTLQELSISGKGLHAAVLDCPALVSFDMSSSYVGPSTAYGNRDCVVCTAALALITGCPLVDWRAPLPAPPLSAGVCTLQERARATRRWGKMLGRNRGLGYARTAALQNDEDAVRFAHALTYRPVVDGRLR